MLYAKRCTLSIMESLKKQAAQLQAEINQACERIGLSKKKPS